MPRSPAVQRSQRPPAAATSRRRVGTCRRFPARSAIWPCRSPRRRRWPRERRQGCAVDETCRCIPPIFVTRRRRDRLSPRVIRRCDTADIAATDRLFGSRGTAVVGATAQPCRESTGSFEDLRYSDRRPPGPSAGMRCCEWCPRTRSHGPSPRRGIVDKAGCRRHDAISRRVRIVPGHARRLRPSRPSSRRLCAQVTADAMACGKARPQRAGKRTNPNRTAPVGGRQIGSMPRSTA